MRLPQGSSLLSRVTCCSPELILRCKPCLSMSEILSLSAPAWFSAFHKDAARGSSSATPGSLRAPAASQSVLCLQSHAPGLTGTGYHLNERQPPPLLPNSNDLRCQWDLTSLTYNFFLNFFFF